MKIEELTLSMIDGQRHLTASEDIVSAVAFAARLGWGDVTCYRFVTALVMTDSLQDSSKWRPVLRRIDNLKSTAELAAIKDNRVVTGEIE